MVETTAQKPPCPSCGTRGRVALHVALPRIYYRCAACLDAWEPGAGLDLQQMAEIGHLDVAPLLRPFVAAELQSLQRDLVARFGDAIQLVVFAEELGELAEALATQLLATGCPALTGGAGEHLRRAAASALDLQNHMRAIRGRSPADAPAPGGRRPDVAEEMADVLLCLVANASTLGEDLNAGVMRKIARSRKRLFPEWYSYEDPHGIWAVPPPGGEHGGEESP